MIPPISLQLLIENAIKHNDFSDLSPIVVSITLTQSALVITNAVRKKVLRKTTSGTGLLNLNERYKLVTGQSITVQDNLSTFTVVLPLLKIY